MAVPSTCSIHTNLAPVVLLHVAVLARAIPLRSYLPLVQIYHNDRFTIIANIFKVKSNLVNQHIHCFSI